MSKTKIKPIVKNSDELMNSMYDTPFKAIVQNSKFRKLLSMIISNVTLYSESYIYENLKFLNTELPAENNKERKKITDILASIKGNIINIEANKSAEANKLVKNNLYHHKIAYGKYFSGDDIDNIDIIQLNFNVMNRFDDRLFIEFKMKDETGKFTDEENFRRIHINMAKPLEKYYNNGIKSLSKLEKVLVMFQITSKKELREIAKGVEDLENMADIIDDLNEDEEIIGQYDKEKMDAWMNRVGINQARKEGLEQGSNNKAKEIALNMLKKNMNIEDILEITGLSEKDIEKIKSEEN